MCCLANCVWSCLLNSTTLSCRIFISILCLYTSWKRKRTKYFSIWKQYKKCCGWKSQLVVFCQVVTNRHSANVFRSHNDSFGRLQLFCLYIFPCTQLHVANCTIVASQMNHHMIWIGWQQGGKQVSRIHLSISWFAGYLVQFHLTSDWSRYNKHSRNFLMFAVLTPSLPKGHPFTSKIVWR